MNKAAEKRAEVSRIFSLSDLNVQLALNMIKQSPAQPQLEAMKTLPSQVNYQHQGSSVPFGAAQLFSNCSLGLFVFLL